MLLGNLSIKEIENRLEITFPEELKNYMKENRQENMSIKLKKKILAWF